MKTHRWLALLLLGSAEMVVAQTTSNRPPVDGASPSSGSGGAIARRIGIRAAVEGTYDSNVFGVSRAVSDRGGAQGRSRSDFYVTPGVQLDILLPFGRQSAFLRGQVGYDFHVNNKQLDRERILLDGGVNLAVGSSCSGTAMAGYSRVRSNAGDIFIIAADPIAVRNNVATRTTVGGQVRCGGAIGLSPSFGYQHSELRNSSPLLKLNNSNQDVFDASLGYQRPTLGRISVFGSYSRGEYPSRDINFNSRFIDPVTGTPNPLFDPRFLDGVESYSAGLRFERSIGSRASGAISAGYSWVNPQSPLSSPFRGSNYALNLSLRPTDKFSVDLLASRSADLSNTVFTSFSVTEVYSLNGGYRLNERMRFGFGVSHQIRDYRITAVAIDRINLLTKDEFTRVYGSASYDLNARLRLTGLISQQRRKSDNALFNYTNTTASLGVSLALGR